MPRTEAGKRLLDEWNATTEAADREWAIDAIEAEAATLDEERLARAIEFADAHEWDLGGAPKWAAAIAKAYREDTDAHD